MIILFVLNRKTRLYSVWSLCMYGIICQQHLEWDIFYSNHLWLYYLSPTVRMDVFSGYLFVWQIKFISQKVRMGKIYLVLTCVCHLLFITNNKNRTVLSGYLSVWFYCLSPTVRTVNLRSEVKWTWLVDCSWARRRVKRRIMRGLYSSEYFELRYVRML